jgi:hypothetical protein
VVLLIKALLLCHGVVFEKFALMSLDSIAISVFRAALLGAASEPLGGWSAHNGTAGKR